MSALTREKLTELYADYVEAEDGPEKTHCLLVLIVAVQEFRTALVEEVDMMIASAGRLVCFDAGDATAEQRLVTDVKMDVLDVAELLGLA